LRYFSCHQVLVFSNIRGIYEHSVLKVVRYEVDQVIRDSHAMKCLQNKVPVGRVEAFLTSRVQTRQYSFEPPSHLSPSIALAASWVTVWIASMVLLFLRKPNWWSDSALSWSSSFSRWVQIMRANTFPVVFSIHRGLYDDASSFTLAGRFVG